MTETFDPEYEKKANTLLERLKAKDPLFDLHVEFGKLLMKNVNDFTKEEKKRYEELNKILMDARRDSNSAHC